MGTPGTARKPLPGGVAAARRGAAPHGAWPAGRPGAAGRPGRLRSQPPTGGDLPAPLGAAARPAQAALMAMALRTEYLPWSSFQVMLPNCHPDGAILGTVIDRVYAFHCPGAEKDRAVSLGVSGLIL